MTAKLFNLLCIAVLLSSLPSARVAGILGRSRSINHWADRPRQRSLTFQLKEAECAIQGYLNSKGHANGTFYIQGWRWHTMSLIREASRLSRFAEYCLAQDPTRTIVTKLKQATDYVVAFNMRGLHKIEHDLFFPWACKKAAAAPDLDPNVASAFANLMKCLEQERRIVQDTGKIMIAAAQKAIRVSEYRQTRETRQLILEVVKCARAIADRGQFMLNLEDALLVPTLASIVPASDQKAFNSKVIRSLGILDSRLYLVAMHEAIAQNAHELLVFQESIPALPRYMIPRWKETLYEPRIGALSQY